MKLADIRPQHLNLLYEQLAQPGIRGGFTEKAYAKVDFKALLKEKGLTMHGLEVKLPGNKHHSILNLCSGGAVKAETAKMIADMLEMSAMTLFRFETDGRPLSGSTIGGYPYIGINDSGAGREGDADPLQPGGQGYTA